MSGAAGACLYSWDRRAWEWGRYLIDVDLPELGKELSWWAVVDDFGDLVTVRG